MEQAETVIAAARRVAGELEESVCVAVVESGGTMVAFARMDGASPAAVDAAKRNADIALAFGFDTVHITTPIPGDHRVPDRRQPDGHSLVPNGGGVIIRMNGTVVGAVGVCGAASSIVDHKIGTAAVSDLT